MSIDKKFWYIKDYPSKTVMYEDFFKASSPFFDTPDRRATFLTGFVTKKLLNLQYANEKRKPFMPKLKGLKLNRKDIKRLLAEVQGKFQEYNQEYYNEELTLASEYLIKSNGLNDISDLDVPFYFALGMNMERNFKLSLDEEELD